MSKADKQVLGWLALASISVPLWAASKIARYNIGCPSSGDCYLLGWETHNMIENFLGMWFIFIMPLAAFMIIRINIKSEP